MALFKSTRAVRYSDEILAMSCSCLCLQKVKKWYQQEVVKLAPGGPSAASLTKSQLDNAIKSLLTVIVPKPRKPQESQFYSTKYYSDRVLPHMSEKYQAEVLAAQAEGRPAPEPHIDDRNGAARKAWNNESVEFREKVKKELEAEWKMEMEAYEQAFVEIPKEGRAYNW